jgi:hypothetical protein
MISQAIADLPTINADAPVCDHGETADNPIPVPKASRISDNAAATKAPAITAAQDTPDAYASFLAKLSGIPAVVGVAECSILITSHAVYDRDLRFFEVSSAQFWRSTMPQPPTIALDALYSP